jgi:hypothetical protein
MQHGGQGGRLGHHEGLVDHVELRHEPNRTARRPARRLQPVR